jgi:hypothetical protein
MGARRRAGLKGEFLTFAQEVLAAACEVGRELFEDASREFTSVHGASLSDARMPLPGTLFKR